MGVHTNMDTLVALCWAGTLIICCPVIILWALGMVFGPIYNEWVKNVRK